MSSTKLSIVPLFTLAAVILMVGTYFTPIWKVSLASPQYREESFPGGLRVDVHFNGVFNGCKGVVIKHSEVFQGDLGGVNEDELRRQVNEPQGLDCLHEMNVINHYVGMYPMQMGAPVERALAPYLFGFLTVMLVAFAAERRRTQMIILAVGFAGVLVWTLGELFFMGRLQQYLAEFRETNSSLYFHDPTAVGRWVDTLHWVIPAAVAGMAVLMLLILGGVWKSRKFTLVLAAVPALLPILFLADYAGWNWFFGHNMSPLRAFPLKPFTPTVFGVGTVAQFHTYSYPLYGFGLLVLVTLLLLPAMVLRLKALRLKAPDGAPT
jgi:hypothetical protein